jgi:ribosomal protein S18 acetylase RimI-like enzyme
MSHQGEHLSGNTEGLSKVLDYEIREMTIDDYNHVYAFWSSVEGLKMDESDTSENIETYLKRNPRLSYVAVMGQEIIGTIKAGQDGRRGYMYHLAVKDNLRKQGIAKALYSKCVEEFKRQGIWRCNLYVLDSNKSALSFWEHNGWTPMECNFRMLQKVLK